MFQGARCRTWCRCRGCPAIRRTSTLLHVLTSDLVNGERDFLNQSKYARGCSAIRQTSILLRTARELLPRNLRCRTETHGAFLIATEELDEEPFPCRSC